MSTAGLEPDSIAYPLRKVFRKNKDFHFRLAEVKNIDADKNHIETSIGSLSYDYLVIATGTRTNFFGNKSIEANSMPMKTIPQALDIRSLILQNTKSIKSNSSSSKSIFELILKQQTLSNINSTDPAVPKFPPYLLK